MCSEMEKGFNLRRMKQEGGRWVKKGGERKYGYSSIGIGDKGGGDGYKIPLIMNYRVFQSTPAYLPLRKVLY